MNAQNPKDWLTKAARDLNLAHDAYQLGKDYWDIICYHCQQATEKNFKAYLIHSQIVFPRTRTHDLELLLNLIATQTSVPPDFMDLALAINDYSIHVRYPGFPSEPGKVEAAEAIRIAEAMRDFILSNMFD
jgi:HEPN domain-containing protein